MSDVVGTLGNRERSKVFCILEAMAADLEMIERIHVACRTELALECDRRVYWQAYSAFYRLEGLHNSLPKNLTDPESGALPYAPRAGITGSPALLWSYIGLCVAQYAPAIAALKAALDD